MTAIVTVQRQIGIFLSPQPKTPSSLSAPEIQRSHKNRKPPSVPVSNAGMSLAASICHTKAAQGHQTLIKLQSPSYPQTHDNRPTATIKHAALISRNHRFIGSMSSNQRNVCLNSLLHFPCAGLLWQYHPVYRTVLTSCQSDLHFTRLPLNTPEEGPVYSLFPQLCCKLC